MRAVVQRVKSSSVSVGEELISEIGMGLNVLLGISKEDGIEDLMYLKDKILNLRIFEDEDGKLNRSLLDVNGELMIVSQFTLYGDCRRGRRPSFTEAQGGDKAEELYVLFTEECKKQVQVVRNGVFGADMLVKINNDGPVTILLDSKKNF